MNQRAGCTQTTLEILGRSGCSSGPCLFRCLSRCCCCFILFGPVNSLAGKPDFAIVRVHSQNLDLDVVANLDDLFGVFDLVIGQFRDVEQAFQTILESDKHAEVRDLCDLAFHQFARLIAIRDVVYPGIFVELFQAKSDTTSFLVDRKNSAFDLFTLLKHFIGMADLSRPGHVGNV